MSEQHYWWKVATPWERSTVDTITHSIAELRAETQELLRKRRQIINRTYHRSARQRGMVLSGAKRRKVEQMEAAE